MHFESFFNLGNKPFGGFYCEKSTFFPQFVTLVGYLRILCACLCVCERGWQWWWVMF